MTKLRQKARLGLEARCGELTMPWIELEPGAIP
jgi:hypothetical protein